MPPLVNFIYSQGFDTSFNTYDSQFKPLVWTSGPRGRITSTSDRYIQNRTHCLHSSPDPDPLSHSLSHKQESGGHPWLSCHAAPIILSILACCQFSSSDSPSSLGRPCWENEALTTRLHCDRRAGGPSPGLPWTPPSAPLTSADSTLCPFVVINCDHA